MKNINGWFSNPTTCLFLLTIIILTVLFWYLPGAESDIPAWIQAGGSVLAIIASFGIADWSRKSELRERRKNLFAVVQSAHAYAGKILKIVDDSKPSERMVNFAIHDLYHRSITDGFAQSLANIPFHEVGTSDAIQAIIDMQSQFARFMPDSLDKFIAGPQNNIYFNAAVKQLDLTNRPRRFQEKEKLFEDTFNIMAKNLRGNLMRIDEDFQLIKLSKYINNEEN